MKTNLKDRSNYFKSLLILIGIDGRLTIEERELLKEIGYYIGFSKKYILDVIQELFSNDYIELEPYQFSDQKIAESLIKDAITLASSDGEISPNELKWLESISTLNGLTAEWLQEELNKQQATIGKSKLTTKLEIFNIKEFSKDFWEP